ncbi:hypothetical protein [Synechococcus sp. MIT S9503]|uniref:hypothetical protein n=1 Tax=Synechococcus sp. MIT S9503 TaxID=3082547 RepID=UPI0039A5C183
MAAAEINSAMVQQLSRQLHSVSEIAESLTLRLLALEERFEHVHQQSTTELSDDEPDEASRQLLNDSGDRLRHLRGLLDEDSPSQVIELVSPTDEEMQDAPLADSICPQEEADDDDEPEPSVNETVYVDDPQIDPAHDELEEQSGNDQIDLLSA